MPSFTTTPNPGGSNTVTGTFTATGDEFPYYCLMYDDAVDANNGYPLDASRIGDPTPSFTVIDTDVPDGTYTIDWVCYLARGGYDGTTRALPQQQGYSAPTTLVVPAVGPEEPEPGCTGSVCLPTGSFGF
ncbi:hypothetical protein [Rhodococcus sp. BS-15]|uniref:hypothetical protein n=1 Tax=Rhodococcus sp. BS-15 TaxID=1304954 RepID=UPI000B000402|nr:hypothetical protein [Rhodococcus sp. BS-15]